jgi:hypothetical protein
MIIMMKPHLRLKKETWYNLRIWKPSTGPLIWWEANNLQSQHMQKEMQHIYFLGPVLLYKNNVLRAASFKCPAFMHVVASFPAR